MASSREVFQLRGSTIDEVKREMNDYLLRLVRQLDDLQGLIAATKQFDDLNLQGKRIISLGDPSADNDAQKKGLALSRSSMAGNWDAGGKKITNGVEGTNPTDVAIVRQVLAAGEVSVHTHQSTTTGGQLDHGLALTGLGDDDHSIYYLADGTRALTGAFNHDGATFGALTAAPASQQTASANLTDSTGQTPDDTIANIAALANSPAALADAAERAEVNTRLDIIEANISDVTAKVNKALTNDRTFGFMAT